MNYDSLALKKQLLDKFRPLPPELVENLENWFKTELTYTSNAIEGNTLTRHETSVIIEKGITIGGKSLKEHLEATNHAEAINYIKGLLAKGKTSYSNKDILSIHQIILKGIEDENAGRYRRVPVRILGSTVIMPNPQKVPQLMDDFHGWLTSPSSLHPVAFAAQAHYQLVTIHPFTDGNGRTARLLMNLLLLSHGYPPAIILPKERLAYISSLEKAQLGGALDDYEKIIIKAVSRSLDIYLKAVSPQAMDPILSVDNDKYLKIGELTKTVNETVSTIRYWTKENLLQAAEITSSGYTLYDKSMIDQCKKIQSLKAKRFTLNEIREKL